jgi:hypothetical protein
VRGTAPLAFHLPSYTYRLANIGIAPFYSLPPSTIASSALRPRSGVAKYLYGGVCHDENHHQNLEFGSSRHRARPMTGFHDETGASLACHAEGSEIRTRFQIPGQH